MPTESRPLYGSSFNTWDPKALDHAMQGITSVLLSLKKKPIIRYEKMSPMAKKLGVEIQVMRLISYLTVSNLSLAPYAVRIWSL